MAMMNSLLLALDGSEQSLHAAEFAWQLAKASKAKVVAQTVVDSSATWKLIAPGEPGLIGSGPYVMAHESIKAALHTIADALVVSYETRAKGTGVQSQSVIDEGDIVEEILKRANDHDLVIIGHRRSRTNERTGRQRGFSPYSVTEEVAHYCPKPLLIVQHKQLPWKSARLVVSPETFNTTTLNAFLEFTAPYAIPLQIYCIGSDETINKLLSQVRASVSKSKNITVLAYDPSEGDDPFDCAVDVNAEALLVITTTGKKERQTCAGTSLASFVRYLTPATILILPAEMREPALQSPGTKGRSASK
jgi:nucleotide-binding universal stress UspA family protein